ncbi:hypothetical protein [Pleurocapsa sp. FMAR1]|uniref:hypothetical protein n=1 Tax=Pleurocapsa sp. FMAR1 TaxID=3040204 RepID=UPI0029C8CBD0|nr:hypothetical protein [Pleurocapsa sp. FMAR1]
MKIIQNTISIIDNFWSKLSKKRTELKIWRKGDREGNSYWVVFNPITGSYNHFSDEQEVRIWLEKSYYAQAK